MSNRNDNIAIHVADSGSESDSAPESDRDDPSQPRREPPLRPTAPTEGYSSGSETDSSSDEGDGTTNLALMGYGSVATPETDGANMQPLLLRGPSMVTPKRGWNTAKPRKYCHCFDSRATCVSTMTIITLLVLASFGVLARFVILPSMVTTALNERRMQFASVNMTGPQASSVHLSGVAMIDDPPASIGLGMKSESLQVLFKEPHQSILSPVGYFAVERAKLSPTGEVRIDTEMTVTKIPAFSALSRAMFTQSVVTWHVRGLVTIYVTLWGSTFDLSGIQLNKGITMEGCSSFPETTIEHFSVTQHGSQVQATLTLGLWNPSAISIAPAGDVLFDATIHVDGLSTSIGPPIRVPGMAVTQGYNQYTATGILDPVNMHVADLLFTNFLGTQSTALVATVPVNGSSIPLYSEALTGLSLTTMLSPLGKPIVEHGTGIANITEIIHMDEKSHHLEIPVRLTVRNSFDVDITIFSVSGGVYYNDSEIGFNEIGYADFKPWDAPNISIPMNCSFEAPPVAIFLYLNHSRAVDDVVDALLAELQHGVAFVTMNTTIGLTIGSTDIHAHVNYYQEHIPLTVASH